METSQEFLEKMAISNTYGDQYDCLVEIDNCISNTADGDIPEFVSNIRKLLKIKLQEVIENEDE
jgi:hypothetical protein